MAQENDVEQELLNLFNRAIEDLTKGKQALKSKDSIQDSADRFIKLSKRFFDIYKLFDSEFRETVDVVACKSLLIFARACFIVSHNLLNTDWLSLPKNQKLSRQIQTLPKRAVHKVIKRTFKKLQYVYNHEDEEYKKMGFGQVYKGAAASQSPLKRNYQEELLNVAVGLKEVGGKLLLIAKHSGLINEKIKLADIDKQIPDRKEFTLDMGLQDLHTCHETLKAYYEVVIEQLAEGERLKEQGITDIDYDLCLLPLMEKLNMTKRDLLRGTVNFPEKGAQFLDVANSMEDLNKTTTMMFLLDYGPQLHSDAQALVTAKTI